MKQNIPFFQGIFLLLSAVLLLPGCSGSESDEQEKGGGSQPEIRFNADVWRVMEGTRATTVDAGTLTNCGFVVYAFYNTTTTCYINGEVVNYTAGVSSWVHSQTWPRDNSALDFFALMPATLPLPNYISVDSTPYDAGSNPDGYSEGSPRFVCSDLPMDVSASSDSQEIVCAFVANQSEENQGEPGVELNFKRPFARINFQLSNLHPNITINSITFKGLKSGGICTFNGSTSTWSALTPEDETVDFKVTLNQVCNNNPDSPVQLGSTYMVIPQTFGGEITVNASWIDWGETFPHNVSTTIPSLTWAAGTSYTYTFTITENDLKVNTTKFTEQW